MQVRGADRRVLVFGPGGDVDTAGVYRLVGKAEAGERAIDSLLQRVAVVSTTHLPFITALGKGSLVAGVAHADQVRDAEIAARIKAGTTVEIARAEGLDRERLLALDPQLLFDYPFGRSEQRTTEFESTVVVTEYLEQHPLGRAEWVRFFGMLLGREHMADSLFEAIAHRYDTARDLSGLFSHRPKVLFGSHWDHRWYAPPGNSYMATLINDAGGDYCFSDTVADGNITLALEQVIRVGGDIEHLGVLLALPGKVDAMAMTGGDPRIAGLGAVRKGGFVGNSTRDDVFGQALLEPEVVLEDLRCIFHPAACMGHSQRYFRRVGQ
jgi:iron complex transport system substrate-binding protein